MTSQTEPSQLVESCVKLFQKISDDPSFGQLRTLIGENEELRTKTASLQTAYDQNLQTLASIQQDVKTERGRTASKAAELESSQSSASGLKRKIAQTEATLKEKGSQLDANAELMSKLQGELKKREALTGQLQQDLKGAKSDVEKAKKAEHEAQVQLETLQAELKKRETRLSKLDSFVIKLQPEPSDDIRDQLSAIFDASFSLMRNFLGIDLATDVLSESTTWNEIRNHRAVMRAIPVPSTNSFAAKKMRVAAALTILASALVEHVFQPTYLLGDNELARLLTDLAFDDPEREAHLRSALLSLDPPRQKAHAIERAQKASSELSKYVSPLLPGSKQDQFTSALRAICQDARRCWARVLRLPDRVDPIFGVGIVPYANDWKLMQFPGVDGQPSKARGSPPGGKGDGVRPRTGARLSSGAENVAAFVWPAFILFGDEQETLKEGLVLEDCQVKDAKAEENSEFASGPRRMVRQQSRRHSTLNEGEATRKKAFLSTGAGGPSGGD
ncbi:hypothetical protein LZ30DRAFT_769929 [Colletotrichum cereale]|nr:hypothetical protein LZ30DRAFT_769929 [Colletotrichum cereale]